MPKRTYAASAIAQTWAQLRTAEATEQGPCWMWPGATNGKGYGVTKRNGENVASRAVWVEVHGPIPAGMLVCHRCDTPGCVRPSHLFLGSAADNTADMVTKQRVGVTFDLDNGQAKVGPEAVVDMRTRRAGGEQVKRIAADYDLHPSHVSRITRGLRRLT